MNGIVLTDNECASTEEIVVITYVCTAGRGCIFEGAPGENKGE